MGYRGKLAQMEGQRETFTAIFERKGTKSGWKGSILSTILLKDVKNEQGEFVTDHVWMNMTEGFAQVELSPGDVVEFQARVLPYVKGYFGRREDVFVEAGIDYKLSRPTKIKKR